MKVPVPSIIRAVSISGAFGGNGAVARRVHDEGMPASQGELVRDMLDWFAASGRVPDESTVRRRVQALWPVLTRRAG